MKPFLNSNTSFTALVALVFLTSEATPFQQRKGFKVVVVSVKNAAFP
jgi:hypothetical protein